jgi:hypothetical protein
VTHREHAGRVGEARGGRHRRISSLPASGKMNSMAVFWDAPPRFLALDGHVEDGDPDDVHSEAWGGLQRRRSWWPGDGRVSIWVKLEQGRKKLS